MPLSSEKTMASVKLVTERSLWAGPCRSLSGVEVTDNVHNARGGFGYAQPPVYEQTPKQVRGDVTKLLLFKTFLDAKAYKLGVHLQKPNLLIREFQLLRCVAKLKIAP